MVNSTHFNQQGLPKIVDISEKKDSFRTASAKSSIFVNGKIYKMIIEKSSKKGDALAVAQIAGMMAAKNTAQIIPMCHPIMISGIDITYNWSVDHKSDTYELIIITNVKSIGATGVEMEALVAACTTALTLYDMCKSICKNLVIGPTILLAKTGGKSDYFHSTTST